MSAPTRLPVRFCTSRQKGRSKHAARVKVSNVPDIFSKTDNFSVAVHDFKVTGTNKLNTYTFMRVCVWIAINRDLIDAFWNDAHVDLAWKPITKERILEIMVKNVNKGRG